MARRHRRRASVDNLGDRSGFDPRRVVSDPNFKPVDPTNAKIGWRAWAVDKDLPPYGNPPKLTSVTHAYVWAPKQKAEAECNYADSHDGVPGAECSCGFYSAKSLKHLMNMGYHAYADLDYLRQFKVVGRVACWGKVIEGTQGWRSQFTYPVELFVPYEVANGFGRPLQQAYGCKVRMLNFLKGPKEITDEDIQALIDGKPMKPVPPPKMKGRRVEHKVLRYAGSTRSAPYEKNGKKVIDVAWDINAERTVIIAMDSLVFEAN